MAVTILQGDVMDRLRELADGSVQCCVTSPPYWALRSYLPADSALKRYELGAEPVHDCLGWATGQPCGACYVCKMVQVFREVRRVLRDDGVLWLNLGDSYAGGGGFCPTAPSSQPDAVKVRGGFGSMLDGRLIKGQIKPGNGLKPKDLCGIPWRVALALQADGWYLRSDVIWAKPNAMPESVQDRCTKSHEYIFMLAKSERYFFDAEAIKEPSTGQTGSAANFARDTKEADVPGQARTQHRTEREPTEDNGTRNKRDVWTIPTFPYSGTHYAVFPPALVEPMIKAGTSQAGACPRCGAAWERVVERESRVPWSERKEKGATRGDLARGYNANHGEGTDHTLGCSTTTLGFRPTCSCQCQYPDVSLPKDDPVRNAYVPVPCTVLDPFAGAGTTLLVADRLGRDAIGIELNPEYVTMAEQRIYGDAPLFAMVEVG
jgi:DNA modification methylase